MISDAQRFVDHCKALGDKNPDDVALSHSFLLEPGQIDDTDDDLRFYYFKDDSVAGSRIGKGANQVWVVNR